MKPTYSRAGYSRRMRRQRQNSIIKGAALAVTLLLLIILIILIFRDTGASPKSPAQTYAPTETPAASETATPTPTPTPTPPQTPVSRRAVSTTPEKCPSPAQDGYLPVFREGGKAEKWICITVDDCNEAANFAEIVALAQQYDAKLTLFPIGENLIKKSAVADTLRLAYSLGYEIENHSYSHSRMYELPEEEMAKEIYLTQQAVCHVLGLDYQPHFLRTRGGDDRNDRRTHEYMDKLGYVGMAHWSHSGASAMKKLKAELAPGNIYLFHCKSSDLKQLREFIPYAVSQGYRLVTMNEMFGFPPNDVKPLTVPATEMKMPAPDPYVFPYDKSITKGVYLWDVFLLQERLKALGYLESDPTGFYGNLTVYAVGSFQQDNGLKADGTATVETQRAIFAQSAIPASAETRARIEEYA